MGRKLRLAQGVLESLLAALHPRALAVIVIISGVSTSLYLASAAVIFTKTCLRRNFVLRAPVST